MSRRPQPDSLPHFVIVGAQKAGSTQLAAALRSRPDVFVPRDEIPFFEDPFFERSSLAELDKAFRSAPPGALRGMKRPDYLAKPECPSRLRAVLDDPRILVVLREPVSRAVSAYYHYVEAGHIPAEPIDVGMPRILAGEYHQRWRRSGEIIEFGRYARHLERYRDTFSSDRILVTLNERLNDEVELSRIQAFLGVRSHAPPRKRPANSGVYDLRRLRFRRLRNRFQFSWDDQCRYTYRSRYVRRPLAQVVSLGISGVDRVVLRAVVGNRRPPLDPALRRTLAELYAGDVARLDALGVDVEPSFRSPAADR